MLSVDQNPWLIKPRRKSEHSGFSVIIIYWVQDTFFIQCSVCLRWSPAALEQTQSKNFFFVILSPPLL